MSMPLKRILQSIKNMQIETITNENGIAIKYPDGTMICRTTLSKEKFLNSETLSISVQGITIYRSAAPVWNFPVSFIDANIQISITTDTSFSGSRLAFGRVNGNLTKSSVEIQLLGLEDFTANKLGYTNLNKVYIIAIGRWK